MYLLQLFGLNAIQPVSPPAVGAVPWVLQADMGREVKFLYFSVVAQGFNPHDPPDFNRVFNFDRSKSFINRRLGHISSVDA